MIDHPDLDSFRSFEEIVENAGFNVEEHWVTTEDGYINKLYRINSPEYTHDISKKNSVALMVHGLIDSSDAWILNGKNNSQALVLASQGYDVWLANTRGNKYSVNHTKLNSDYD